MGDVDLILPTKGNGEDDEDGNNEISGSGDGYDELTTVRTSSHGPPLHDKDSHTNENNLLIYVSVTSAVFAVVIIIIVVAIIFCRRRIKARRARQKSQLSSPGIDMKIVTGNRETRVFANIPGSDVIDLQRIEHERAVSRSLVPPTSIAPPPPKARTAPEAEKLLKTGRSSQDRRELEQESLLPSMPYSESTNHYEEIHFPPDLKTNESENEQFHNKYEKATTISLDNSNIKDTDSHNYEEAVIKPAAVAKPKKIPRNIKFMKDIPEGQWRSESSV